MIKEFFLQLNKEQEQILRCFLIHNTDTIRLTRIIWHHLILPYKTIGSDKDPKFIQLVTSLKDDLIKKEVSNKKFNDVEQGKRKRFEHYYYKLSPAIIKTLNTETLSFKTPPNTLFYGFEDPTFYKNNRMIASIISHENTAILYLDDKQAKELRGKNLNLKQIVPS